MPKEDNRLLMMQILTATNRASNSSKDIKQIVSIRMNSNLVIQVFQAKRINIDMKTMKDINH